MIFRRLTFLAAAAVVCGVLPVATASATGTGALLPTVKRTLTSASTASACATAAGPGRAATSYAAPMSGYLTTRLAGQGDWDLVLRDPAGRVIGASQAFGGDELVQTWIDAGQQVTATACRRRGAGPAATVAFELADFKPSRLARQAPSLVRVHATPERQAELERLGLDVTESRSARWADVIVDGDQQMQILRDSGADLDTRIVDLGAYDRKTLLADQARERRTGLRASSLPSGRDTYRTYDDLQAELKQLAADHKGRVRPVVLGKSYQGREISGVEIGKDVNGTDGRPVFFVMGVHHAREWPSAEIAMEYAELLARGSGDARIQDILARERVVIVPLVNPDGYISSRSSPSAADSITNSPLGDPTGDGTIQTGESVAPPGGVGAYRRKNCDNEDGNRSLPCEAAHGVDNNRNYGNLWGGPGASSDITSQSYHGPGPRSEPETQAVFDYVRTHHVTTLISLHTIAGLVLRPPGLHDGGKAPDEPALKALGDAMGDATGYVSQYSFQLYDTAGTTEDDTYAATGGYGYTIELGPSGGLFHGPYETNVVKQWTGEGDDKANGGMREALLKAAETAKAPSSHAQLTGVAPAGDVLRLRKAFDTKTSRYCVNGVEPVVTTPIPPETACPGGLQDPQTLKDTVNYKTTVPADGKFNWHIGQSTRPFVNGGAEITGAKDVDPPIATFTGQPAPPTTTVDHELTAPADLGAKDQLRVHLSIPTDEDYDLEVFAKQADGSLKSEGTSGNSPPDDEEVVIQAPTAGATYVARVTYFAAVTGQYQLTVNRVATTTTLTTGSKEAYTLTCETPGGKVLEKRRLVIDRGQLVTLRLGCGTGPSTDATGKPLDPSTDCALPNSAPTVGCQAVPTGPATVKLKPVAGKLKVRLRRATRRQGLRNVLRHQRFLAVRCRLSAPGKCVVRARIGRKRLGPKGTRRFRRAGTRPVKIRLSKRARKRLARGVRRGEKVRFTAVARASGRRSRARSLAYRLKP